ncbi:MAG TPA: thioredoxin-like domain-containing protein [Chitinophagaceae bacterium]|nr:thioredoxin-like domain-containing protein [Chitinophagaceae bacterium]
MKRLLLLSCLCISGAMWAQTGGYAISITLKPYKNQYVYLGYYYGKIKALADSVLLNSNSSGVFKGKQKLNGGIYFIVSPKKEILFELLLDKQQQFSIQADSARLPASIKFVNSPENLLFQSYSAYAAANGKTATEMMGSLSTAKTAGDSAAITTRLRALNENMTHYRDSVSAKYPGTLLAALFKSLKEPVVPKSKQPAAAYDSLFAYNYFKGHYWDGISFTDDRLLRTPIFEPRLDKYYKTLVVPDPDSITREVDIMLAKAAPNKEMYKYLLTYFVQQYINPQYMGQDAVFVHLFEKYINNNPAVDWFTEKYKKYMTDRAYSLMANLIGAPAQNLELVDSSDKPRPLYDVKAPYVVICFWDATCSHCKEVVPRLDSIYQAKWKKLGVVIYGVMVDGGKEAWTNYIRDNNLKDWIHVYETSAQRDAGYAAGKPNYRQLYDVYQTPILYLLDKDKRIIAKKLTFDQIDEVLSVKMKQAEKQ